MKSWNLTSVAALVSLAATGFSVTAYARDETLHDLAGRIEYAFYAADSRSLLQGVQALEKLEVATADRELSNSYLNYGRWKLAQLLAKEDPDQAQVFAQVCADSKLSAKSNSVLAIHHALVAACMDMLETLRPLRSMLYRRDREAALASALQTGGKLAQVEFVAAWLALSNSKKDDAGQDYATIKQAVARYASVEAESQSQNPSWGYAEACYLLGKIEFARGNRLAARNALEQGLVLAPDYREAQQLLQSLNLK